MNETSHDRLLPPRKVLAARSSVPQPFYSRFSAVSEPFLGGNGGKLGFWAAVRSFLVSHDLKRVPARQKRAERAVKAPCSGSIPIVIVVWR
jgi:hypothetical protein